MIDLQDILEVSLVCPWNAGTVSIQFKNEIVIAETTNDTGRGSELSGTTHQAKCSTLYKIILRGYRF